MPITAYLIILTISAIFSIKVANYAESKGLAFGPILLLGIITTPVISFIVTLIMASNTGAMKQESIIAEGTKKCPFCAELIKDEAIVCRFCNRDIPLKQELTNS